MSDRKWTRTQLGRVPPLDPPEGERVTSVRRVGAAVDNARGVGLWTVEPEGLWMIDVRPMTLEDVVGAARVVEAAAEQRDRQTGRQPRSRSDEEREVFLSGLRRFVERDPAGAWVAEDSGSVIGMANAIRR